QNVQPIPERPSEGWLCLLFGTALDGHGLGESVRGGRGCCSGRLVLAVFGPGAVVVTLLVAQVEFGFGDRCRRTLLSRTARARLASSVRHPRTSRWMADRGRPNSAALRRRQAPSITPSCSSRTTATSIPYSAVLLRRAWRSSLSGGGTRSGNSTVKAT